MKEINKNNLLKIKQLINELYFPQDSNLSLDRISQDFYRGKYDLFLINLNKIHKKLTSNNYQNFEIDKCRLNISLAIRINDDFDCYTYFDTYNNIDVLEHDLYCGKYTPRLKRICQAFKDNQELMDSFCEFSDGLYFYSRTMADIQLGEFLGVPNQVIKKFKNILDEIEWDLPLNEFLPEFFKKIKIAQLELYNLKAKVDYDHDMRNFRKVQNALKVIDKSLSLELSRINYQLVQKLEDFLNISNQMNNCLFYHELNLYYMQSPNDVIYLYNKNDKILLRLSLIVSDRGYAYVAFGPFNKKLNLDQELKLKNDLIPVLNILKKEKLRISND